MTSWARHRRRAGPRPGDPTPSPGAGTERGRAPAQGHALQEQPLYCHPAGLSPSGFPLTGGPQDAPDPRRNWTAPVGSVRRCSVRRLIVGSGGRTRIFTGPCGTAPHGLRRCCSRSQAFCTCRRTVRGHTSEPTGKVSGASAGGRSLTQQAHASACPVEFTSPNPPLCLDGEQHTRHSPSTALSPSVPVKITQNTPGAAAAPGSPAGG